MKRESERESLRSVLFLYSAFLDHQQLDGPAISRPGLLHIWFTHILFGNAFRDTPKMFLQVLSIP